MADEPQLNSKILVVDDDPNVVDLVRDRVFDRFFRADPSRARATGGVGLGLTIAKQLVEVHGGTIHVESIVPTGARFVFELPVTPPYNPA